MANKLFHFNGVQAILTDIGLSHQVANTIASASQAVDDFHEDKLITFENGELFYPIVTAHKMLDLDNLDSRDASNIWMPFHFFPNDQGVCEPNSDNVNKLIEFVKKYSCNNETEKSLLHGILLHIYVDTFAHQGFMGLHCQHNDISDLDDKTTWDTGFIMGNISPAIGHGEALTYPDDMWRKWGYSDNQDNAVECDNQALFLTISHRIQWLMAELGYHAKELTSEQIKNYQRIFAINGKGQDYEDKIVAEFDSITQKNVGEGKAISYQKWKNSVMEKVSLKENRYTRIVPIEDFEHAKWVVFQKLAKEFRSFFKKEIFPDIRIKTTVY